MGTFEEELQRVLALNDLLRDCPTSCRNAVLTSLGSKEHFTNPTPDIMGDACCALSWLVFANILKKNPNSEFNVNYLPAMTHLQERMSVFKQIHPELFKKDFIDAAEFSSFNLDALIIEQQERLLNLHLLRYTSAALDRETFSLEQLLDNVSINFKQQMVETTLYQFNLIRLIELKKQLKQSSYTVGILNKLIEQATPNHFSLTAIRNLFHTLSYLEINEFEEALATFLKDEGGINESSLFSELGFQSHESLTSGISTTTKMQLFFDSDQYTNLHAFMDKMMHFMKEKQARVDAEHSPKHHQLSGEPPLRFYNPSTTDENLRQLGNLIQAYADELQIIVTNEKIEYPNRINEHITKRQQAVNTLLRMVNQSQQLTPPIQHIAVKLVHEIQVNQPTWNERSLLNKILDFLLIIPALIRYGTFKRNAKEAELLQATKSYAKDMQALRTHQNEAGDDDSIESDSTAPQ